MESFAPLLIAGFVAGLLTYCDLDTVFDAPPHAMSWGKWARLRGWWWGFVLANAALAAFLFHILRESYFKDINPWLGALAAGGSYTALVRLQVTTLPINGKNTPIGLETIYEGLKNMVHKRINRIIRDWRIEQSRILAQSDLNTLRQQALLMVGADALLTPEQRQAVTAWIEKTAADASTPERDRRRLLALYIVTEQKPTP